MARQGAITIEEIIKNKVANFRRWKQTKLSKRHSKWCFQFSVMTYNILSQTAVENHRYLYRHCNNTFLQEEYRISKILPEILSSRTDIICLQEVEQHLYDDRIKMLFHSNGFESIFKKRTSSKSDGCAILWRTKKFNLLKHAEVEFKTEGNRYLNRDNVGLIAVLKPNHPNSGDTELHVATTHLLFNPKRGEIKLCQLRFLLAELERLALKEVINEERLYHPTILCGDFNIEPESPLYKFIESGYLDATEILSGDLSGQAEGRNKGFHLNGQALSLNLLGINESGRYDTIQGRSTNMTVSEAGSSETLKFEKDSVIAESAQKDINSLTLNTLDDSRWIKSFIPISQEELAAEISTRMLSEKSAATYNPNLNSENSMDHSTESESQLKTNDMCFSHDFKFVPVYKFNSLRKDKPVTSMSGHDWNTVDHIFYNVQKKLNSSTFTEGKLRLLGLYTLMQKDEITELGGLPNAYLGSDHLNLIGQFAMNFKR